VKEESVTPAPGGREEKKGDGAGEWNLTGNSAHFSGTKLRNKRGIPLLNFIKSKAEGGGSGNGRGSRSPGVSYRKGDRRKGEK